MRPPTKVEVDGYEPEYVRVLNVGEARAIDKTEGSEWTKSLVAMALCDAKGRRRFEAADGGVLPSPADLAEVDRMDYPLFEAVARTAADITFGKRKKPDEGKADGPPDGGSSTS